jgi:hypothetical protein
MKLIPEKIIESCAVCPNINYGEYGRINSAINTCGIKNRRIINDTTTPKWCPLEDYIEPVQPCTECGGKGREVVKTSSILKIGTILQCPTCHGTCKNVLVSTNDLSTYEADCPTCKGIGKGEPMLAVLSENQELPNMIQGKYSIKSDYTLAQQDMVKQGWRKVE